MLFSSTLFLFWFLPRVLTGVFVVHPALRNAFLLLASLVFYAWGEPVVVAVMLSSIAVNWGLGLWVARRRTARLPLVATLLFNLGMLVVFKYADWLCGVAGDLLATIGSGGGLPRLGDLWPKDSPLWPVWFAPSGAVRLPIGISFFTFQAMSYVIDVRRGEVPPCKNPLDLALYVALFPQLIAGPIVRYATVADQIRGRSITLAGFAYGVRRFVLGLAKKMLIANTAAQAADPIFALAADDLGTGDAWLGVVCYTAQIYFDFSGYSDMAIGLGAMLGFRFLENFDHPYVAKSITEFWRRWHISLSTWFRDYLYRPLGGNRRGPARTCLNLVVVFALCGLWHGASHTFLAWGLFHGAFLVGERAGLSALLARRHALIRHGYVLLVVMVGWVLFRADSLGRASDHLLAMAGLRSSATGVSHMGLYLDAPLALALAAAVLGSTPWLPWLAARVEAAGRVRETALTLGARTAGLCALLLLYLLCVLQMAAGTYNPFIYFRF